MMKGEEKRPIIHMILNHPEKKAQQQNNFNLAPGSGPLTFENDAGFESLPPHQNLITLEADIAGYRMKRILVDTVAQPDIQFFHAFRKMRLKSRRHSRHAPSLYTDPTINPYWSRGRWHSLCA